MTAYSSYVTDFPSRCGEILEEFRSPALEQGRDVTLLLSISTAALTVPHERLKPRARPRHPLRDRERYPKTAEKYEELLREPFLSSPLWRSRGVSTWKTGRIQDVQSGGPDTWRELRDARSMPPEERVGTVLRILRNALAHGNVFTEGKVIHNIVLLAKEWDSQAFSLISVSPRDFRKFTMNYICFVRGLDLDEVPVGGAPANTGLAR
ncbi:hypothetical protein [Candidatus Palauibacter sp.]|uniref:hypothetical protein n=1 Tax=Candidatus Palauibacter sp. TaxID=3101350 RepID=UPI003B5CA580